MTNSSKYDSGRVNKKGEVQRTSEKHEKLRKNQKALAKNERVGLDLYADNKTLFYNLFCRHITLRVLSCVEMNFPNWRWSYGC